MLVEVVRLLESCDGLSLRWRLVALAKTAQENGICF